MNEDAPITIGSTVDRMFNIRQQRSELAKTDDALKAEFTELELQLINMLDTQETTMTRGRLASATIAEDQYPTDIDWDQVINYIKENDAFHLLQRRLNTAPWRELLIIDGAPIPGTTPYTRRTISLRKL